MSTNEDRGVGSGLTILSVLVLGQAVLILTLNSQLRSLDVRLQNLGIALGTQLRATDAFIKFTTDGVWIRLEEDTGPSIGAQEPQVHVIEFADFQCPACASIAPRLIDLVTREPGAVKLTFKNLPLTDLNPVAFAAALGGACASRFERFWEYSERLYAEQGELSRLGDSFLVDLADELGIDSSAFVRCLESDSARFVVENDLQVAQRLGVTSTPTFFVNGKRLEGANWELLKAAIEWELRPIRRDVASLRSVR